jgi:hypothetical protein
VVTVWYRAVLSLTSSGLSDSVHTGYLQNSPIESIQSIQPGNLCNCCALRTAQNWLTCYWWPPLLLFSLVAHRLSRSRLSFFLLFVSPSNLDTLFDLPSDPRSLPLLAAGRHIPLQQTPSTPPHDTPFFKGFESLVRSL